MSCRKRRRWHFRDPNLKILLLGEHAPRLRQVSGALSALTFLPLGAPSKYHATLPTPVAYVINAQGMEEETWSGRG